MYSIKELKPGRAIEIDNEPYLVTSSQFSKQGRQGGVMATKLKNLKTGSVINKTFSGETKIPPADVGYRHVQFLFGSDGSYTFMDLNDYNQFELTSDLVGETKDYLTDGMELDLFIYNEQPIGVKLPPAVTLEVKETTPGVKGDTATGGTKPATLETGVVISVPLFVNEGDKVKVNTERGEYVERV